MKFFSLILCNFFMFGGNSDRSSSVSSMDSTATQLVQIIQSDDDDQLASSMDSITTQMLILEDESEDEQKKILIEDILQLLEKNMNIESKIFSLSIMNYLLMPDTFNIFEKIFGKIKTHAIIACCILQITMIYTYYHFYKNVEYSTKSLEDLQQNYREKTTANMHLNKNYYTYGIILKLILLHTTYKSDTNKMLKLSACFVLTKNLIDEYKNSEVQKIVSPIIQVYYDKNMKKVSLIKNAASPLLQKTNSLTEAIYDTINPLIKTMRDIFA